MLIPGNMWVEVWQSARPVPARRQRRLFDDTKEAEKVKKEIRILLTLIIGKFHTEALGSTRYFDHNRLPSKRAKVIKSPTDT